MLRDVTTEFPDFGLTEEERREAVFGHRYERAGMGGDRGEIWGYTDSLCYPPGATVRLCVNSTAERYRFTVLRDGASSRTVLEQEVRGARWQETPEQCSVLGCGWEPSVEFPIGKDWPSGAYRVTLARSNGLPKSFGKTQRG